jgi:hypothetical protein
MKAITMRIQKFSRPGVILTAIVVVIITSIVVANATQTITAPNAAFVSYNLAAGTSSAAITPVANKSVLVMGCVSDQSGDDGVGQVTLLRVGTSFIQWVGLESTFNAAITQGVTVQTGTHILYINRAHSVEIQTASSDTILIHNGSAGTRAGNVTLIW